MTSEIWISLEWLPNILFLNNKLSIKTKQVLLQNHACFDSQRDITNKSHSNHQFNVLVTGVCQLGTCINKPKKN